MSPQLPQRAAAPLRDYEESSECPQSATSSSFEHDRQLEAYTSSRSNHSPLAAAPWVQDMVSVFGEYLALATTPCVMRVRAVSPEPPEPAPALTARVRNPTPAPPRPSLRLI